MSDFTYPNETPVKLVDCEKAFIALTNKEKLYAHYLSKASFYGSLIVLPQTSLESSLIFVVLHKLFKAQSISELKQIALEKCDFNEDEFCALLIYTAGLISSMGNYKDFGYTKFIPNLPKEKFQKLIMASKAAELEPEKMQSLLSQCIGPIFSLEDKEKQLGFPYIGKTTYLSKNFTKEDQEIVKEFFKKQELEPVNTRLFKTFDHNGTSCYEVRLASVLQTDDDEAKSLVSASVVNDHKFVTTRGDYSKLLKLVNKYLQFAKDYAANENEVKMIENYIQSFHTGSVDSHKEGSRYWIKDKGPIVESYIGFIETYKDPAGMRAEFEGFVAVVNKAMSVKFADLVNAATDILPHLPWPTEYEKDKFLHPDFTSLDILTYGGSGIPTGICIPNYQEIRQYEGFKNFSLGNVIRLKSLKNANFLKKEDQDLLENYFLDSFEVQVGLHELLGHGSGKLFEKKNGTFNFDINKVKHLETGEKITTYYDEGENYDSVFSSLASSYEECRAECTGLYLCLEPEVLKIFGHEGDKAEKVLCCNWLEMLYKGIESLKMYEPTTESWLQAHSQARYVILQVCIEAGEDFVSIERIKGEDGNPDLLLTVDYNKIKSVGKDAIGAFLRKLQVYKATADVEAAKTMFNKYSAVTCEDKYPFLEYREIVMARKKPRDIFLQANTVVEDGNIRLVNYESSPEGLIQSWIDRFEDENVDSLLIEIWEKEKPHFITLPLSESKVPYISAILKYFGRKRYNNIMPKDIFYGIKDTNEELCKMQVLKQKLQFLSEFGLLFCKEDKYSFSYTSKFEFSELLDISNFVLSNYLNLYSKEPMVPDTPTKKKFKSAPITSSTDEKLKQSKSFKISQQLLTMVCSNKTSVFQLKELGKNIMESLQEASDINIILSAVFLFQKGFLKYTANENTIEYKYVSKEDCKCLRNLCNWILSPESYKLCYGLESKLTSEKIRSAPVNVSLDSSCETEKPHYEEFRFYQ